MKTSLRRSVSCNYRYDPVAASDTDDSVIDDRQEPTPKKRPRTQRAVSDPGVNNPETNDSPPTTQMAEHNEIQLIRHDDSPQTKDNLNNGNSTDDENGRHSGLPNASVIKRNLVIAAILFIVSLVLHFYTLSIFFTKNQDSTNNTQSKTSIQDSFRGGEHGTGQVECLLTIKYTDYVKEVDDTTRNCTKMHNDAELGIGDITIVGLKRYSKKCFCTKQIPLQDKSKLKTLQCCGCNGYFPICQNGGVRHECTNIYLLEQICGVCDCSEEYTGNYCHLSKKLECVKCNGTSCDDLPPCNNSTVRPCRESFDSQMMNCTNPVNLEVKDCSPQSDTTDLKDYQPKSTKTSFMLNKTDHAQKSTDHAQKSTDHTQKSCSRNAAYGYFVLDWIVFIGIIMQFTFVFNGHRCKNCIKIQQWKFVYKGYIFSVLMLIIIPPIINCVTCCSKTCDTLGKLFPFIKSLSLVLTVILLYCGIRSKGFRAR
eukprot:XP_011456761.1 PREDICTED: uncharacterized protein LOC105348870 [Crassostrea gigas]